MNLLHCLLIVMICMANNAISMDKIRIEHECNTIWDMVYRFGMLDFSVIRTLALVCKLTSKWSMNSVKEKEGLLENDYKSLLKEKIECGALITLSKNRDAYGFIGIFKKCDKCYDNRHAVYLMLKKYNGSSCTGLIDDSKFICEIFMDTDFQNHWVNDFENRASPTFMTPLVYKCVGRTFEHSELSSKFDTVSIQKPVFIDDRLKTVFSFAPKKVSIHDLEPSSENSEVEINVNPQYDDDDNGCCSD